MKHFPSPWRNLVLNTLMRYDAFVQNVEMELNYLAPILSKSTMN